MEHTGRIKRGLTPTARRILFGATTEESVAAELKQVARVDRAHLLMLAEQRIIARAQAADLLRTINELEQTGFAPLLTMPAPRGLYLAYEDYLIEQLGGATGGVLQTARSRNDLNATILKLRLRAPYLNLLRESLRLTAVLIRLARRYAGVTMPAYTHYQAAVPVTYGHYLAGVASALQRDAASLLALSDDLNSSPLGAGAVGGTSWAIEPQRTAELLGFNSTVDHSIDAVASRDLVLRLLASVTVFGVTLSRLVSDLLLWTTSEFEFLSVPDELVGSSSMMPQKRNPFMLEHVQGRSGVVLGAFAGAVTAMHGKPFTNSIAVGTEAVKPVWDALKSITEATTLLRLFVAGARPNDAAMLQRAVVGYTSATELANRFVSEEGWAFRRAHYEVGVLINEAIERGETLESALARKRNGNSAKTDLDPSAVAKASAFGGGPGAASVARIIDQLRQRWRVQSEAKRNLANQWAAAELSLRETAKNFVRDFNEEKVQHV